MYIRNSFWSLPGRKRGIFSDLARVANFRVIVMFGVAGFRPGRRGPFVSAKGPKTIDAPSGLIEAEGRKEGGPTRRAQTRPASG